MLSHDIAYMWDLKKEYKETYIPNRKRPTVIENKFMAAKGEG